MDKTGLIGLELHQAEAILRNAGEQYSVQYTRPPRKREETGAQDALRKDFVVGVRGEILLASGFLIPDLLAYKNGEGNDI